MYAKSLKNISPTAGSSAPAARSTTKSTKPTATTPASTKSSTAAPAAAATTAIASAPATHEKRKQPPASAHSAATASSAARDNGTKNSEDYEENNQKCERANRGAATLRSVCGPTSRRLARECDAFFVGDVLCQLPGGDFYCGTKIILSQEGDHGATGIAGASVIDNWLDAITNFDSILAIVGSQQQQNARAFFFGANTQVFEKIHSVVFDRAIIEGSDGDDGHLRGGLLFEFSAESFQTLVRGLWNNACEIGDVADRRNLGNIIGGNAAHTEEEQKENAEDR